MLGQFDWPRTGVRAYFTGVGAVNDRHIFSTAAADTTLYSNYSTTSAGNSNNSKDHRRHDTAIETAYKSDDHPDIVEK